MNNLAQSKTVLSLISFYYFSVTAFLHRFILPLFLLTLRFLMAKLFWNAGIAKLTNWQAAVTLFASYKIFFLSAEATVYLIMSLELVGAVLLIAGLGTRLAALCLSLLILTMPFYILANEHYYWFIILLMIFLHGPGLISLDHYLIKKFKLKPACHL